MSHGFADAHLVNSLRKDRFHLILFPTEECNLRCVYCYEDFAIGRMPEWLVSATKSLIMRKMKSLKHMELSWFGGEPLLAKDILFDITEHAQQLAQENDCVVTGNTTTNGVLLDVKTLTKLVQLNQRSFQISIDGDESQHNQTRISKAGKGSFGKIWQRLIDAANTDLSFNIMLRIHVTAFNQDSIRDFLDKYQTHLADDPRFRLFFKDIVDLGGDNSDQAKALGKLNDPRKAAAALQQEFQPTESKGDYICYASKPNSLAIRANGNLNKCTVALKDDHNHIGRINADGTLQVDNRKFGSWIEGFSSMNSWQMGCPHSFIQANKKQNEPVGDIAITNVA